MVDFETGSDEKLAYFQAITGIDDPALCTEILTAHNWNLELAISTITNNAGPSNEPNPDSWQTLQEPNHSANLDDDRSLQLQNHPNPPGLAWKLLTLPFSVSLGLVTRAIGLGMWVGSGVVSHSLGFLGWGSRRGEDGVSSSAPLVSVSASAIEAMSFVSSFERDYGGSCHPNFVREGFMEALQRSREGFKLLFVYLHSQDHPDTQIFCENTLCSEAVAAFVNENFVAWGGSIRASEGFKMSNSLKASRFPFCAVVMAAANQRIALLQQVEGPESPEQLLSVLQKVIEESAPVLVTARLDEEERRNNRRLREEQDAAYRAALEADQARERQRIEEEERLEREAAEAELKLREEELAVERAAHEAAEKEAALERRRQEKAMSLGPEPEKGPDVTQVLVRFPTGERKERRFHSSAMIRSLYDFVDSLDCLEAEKYSLVSNFPRVIYNSEKHSLTLREAGLHPQASLFVEVNT